MDISDVMNSLHPPMPEGKEHLVYRDFPKMSEHIWVWILEQLEPFELQVLTSARYRAKDGNMLGRGQIFVHLDGLKELKVAYERDKNILFPKQT